VFKKNCSSSGEGVGKIDKLERRKSEVVELVEGGVEEVFRFAILLGGGIRAG